ncbi:MAG: hypothetical protein GWP91_24615 [Rhodobacterales bacterium]|nr:hypothetical protein [Rhodobacterales bacterium]
MRVHYLDPMTLVLNDGHGKGWTPDLPDGIAMHAFIRRELSRVMHQRRAIATRRLRCTVSRWRH